MAFSTERCIAFLSMGLLLAGGVSASAADDYYSPAQVFVWLSQHAHFVPNTTVDVYVEAYYRGARTDPDWLVGSMEWGYSNTTNLTFSRLSGNRFSTNFTVTGGFLVSPGASSFHVRVNASVTGIVQNRSLFLWAEPGPVLPAHRLSTFVWVNTSMEGGRTFEPGEVLPIGVVVRYDDDLVDADDVSVVVDRLGSQAPGADPGPPLSTESLPLNRDSLGTYGSTYTVPVDIDRTEHFELTVNASYKGLQSSGHQSIAVHSLPLFIIVANSTNVSAELWVLVGNQSTPVPGALVEAMVQYDARGCTLRNPCNLTAPAVRTDSRGFARFLFEFPETSTADAYVTASLEDRTGTADIQVVRHTAGGLDELLLPPPAPYYSNATGWSIELVDPIPEFGPGPQPPFRVRAVADGEAAVNASVSYLLMGAMYYASYYGPSVHAFGNATTDAAGIFEIGREGPASAGGELTLWVWDPRGRGAMASLEIPTIRAQRDTMELAFDGDTLGQPVNFTIRYRGNTTGVGPEAWYSVAPAPDGSLTHFHAQEIWLQASVDGEDGLWTGSFTLPEWWPEGDYLVVTNVVFTPNETAWPPLFGELRWDVIHLNESGRVYPEWEPPPPPDPVGTSETFIPGPGPAALLVAVAAGAVAWDRGRRRPKR